METNADVHFGGWLGIPNLSPPGKNSKANEPLATTILGLSAFAEQGARALGPARNEPQRSFFEVFLLYPRACKPWFPNRGSRLLVEQRLN